MRHKPHQIGSTTIARRRSLFQRMLQSMYTSLFCTDHEYSSNLQWKDCQNLLPLWIEMSICPPMSWSLPTIDPTGQEMVQLWRKWTLCYCVPQSTFTSSSSTVNEANTQSQERFYVSQSNHVMFQLWTGWSFCQSMPRPASTIDSNPRQPKYGTNSSLQEVLQLWTKESLR
jgi:hypothetical protein